MSILISSFSRSLAKNSILTRNFSKYTKLALVSHQKVFDKLESQKPNLNIKKFLSTQAPPVDNAHDHSRLWTLERIVSVALVGVVPLAFMTPNPYLDYALALSLVAHVHWGVEAICIDYIRPRIFGPIIPKIAIGLIYVLSLLALTGLYYFNYTDIGLSQAILMYLKK